MRDVKDWTTTVQRFFSTYDLYGNPSFDSLFINIGEAKFDLTAIAYRARLLIKTANNIKGQHKGQQVSPLNAELTDRVEDLRRALINPSLRDAKVSQVTPGLLMSFEKLQDAISDIEYM